MQFSTALPCMLRGPASVWLWWDVWAEFWVGWQRCRRADYEDVDKFQRRRRRWRRWRRRTSDERWRGALGRCLLTLSHTHTQPEQHTRTQAHSATDVRQAAAPILNTHTDWRQPFWLPHPLYLFLSLSPPPSPPVLVCIVENGFIENVVCFSIWFCSAAFSSSSSFLLFPFSFLLYSIFLHYKIYMKGCECECVCL